MKSAKILYLATGVFDKGGISRYSRYQIQALRELLSNDLIHVFSLLPPMDGGFEDKFSVEYHAHGVSLLSKLLYSIACLTHLWMWRPDVVWANHVHFLLLLGVLKLLRPNIKTVVNIYGRELWSGREAQIRHRLPMISRTIADCHFSARYAIESLSLTEANLTVIWDCVDINRFRPGPRREDLLKRYGIPVGADKRYIMTLGRLSSDVRYKGYDRLIDAMHYWRGDSRVICLIAGSGDDLVRLKKRIVDERLTKQIFFLGSVPESDITHVYNLCHIFTLVSERGLGRGEGIPLTPLEAAATGKPILVGNQDGSQEAVIDGQNGYIVSPDNLDIYIQRLEQLLFNDDVREEMGINARKRIENEFSYEVSKSKLSDVLATLR